MECLNALALPLSATLGSGCESPFGLLPPPLERAEQVLLCCPSFSLTSTCFALMKELLHTRF
jgi:hypothetical protein